MERERSLEEAEQHFSREIRKLKLSFELKKFGDEPFQAVACALFRNNTEKVSEGGGKGFGKQAELSAKFEALEVYTGQLGTSTSSYERFSLNKMREKQFPLLTEKMFPELLCADFPLASEKMPWIPYTRYGSNECRYLPAICTHPFYNRKPFPDDHFDYSTLYLSATTNGIATGCTRQEALIHASLEVIERHSLSLFMIKNFLQDVVSVSIIALQTLPEKLKTISREIIQITGYNLILYSMPNELNIPVYGALLHHEKLQVPIKGSGASLDPVYAVERALLEALEIYYWDPTNVEGSKGVARLKSWPKLLRCAQFDLHKHNVAEQSFAPRSFHECSLEEYFEQIQFKLHQAGFSLYFNETYTSENLSTVHVVIPEAEEFFAVSMGLVLPIKRALC